MAFYKEEEIMSMPLWRQLVEKDWNLLQSIEGRSSHECGMKWLKHYLVESGPALIAMKGLPCSGKSGYASEIATFLRCPCLDLEDIRSCTWQTTHHHLLLSTDPEVSASADSHLDELSCRALLRFASTQLLLGHDVVVDSELSRPEVMHRLMDLADSNGVPLIVIECVVIDESKWRDSLEVRRLVEGHLQRFDGETNDVPRLVVDTTQTRILVADDLKDIILQFILLYKQNLGSKCNATASSSHESVRRDGEKLKRHFSHSHPLTFVPQQDTADMDSSAAAAAAPQCRICLLHITGSSYSCPQCDYSAHESCLELPQYTSFSLHVHPLGLYVQSYDTSRYRSKEDISCIVCNGANKGPIYRCWQCYQVFFHHQCAQLSHELKHPCHDHPLKLETYDLFPKRNQFICRACGHKGGKISYGCLACKLKLHIACAMDLPLEVEYKCAQGHPLVLASPPKHDLDEHYCDVCEEERYRDYWIYYCRSCEFHAHLNCAYPEIQAYDIAKAKKLSDDLSDKVCSVSDEDEEEEEEEIQSYDIAEAKTLSDDLSDKKWLESDDDDGGDDEEEEEIQAYDVAEAKTLSDGLSDKEWLESDDEEEEEEEEEEDGDDEEKEQEEVEE